MKRPAQRRSHRARGQAVRFSGWSGQGTAARPQIKSHLATRHACLMSTNRRNHNNRLPGEVPPAPKIIFAAHRKRGPGPAAPGSRTKRPARSRPFGTDLSGSVTRGDRATPAEAIVDAGLDGVLVVTEAGAENRRRTTGESGAAEIVILVFGLGRPVRREHVFQTGTDREAVLAASIGGKGHRRAGDGYPDIVVVAPGVAALGGEQRRTPRGAASGGYGSKLVVLRGHQHATWKRHAIVVVGKPAVLGFRTDHPVGSELVVEAALHAAQESAAAALQAVVARERAAEMAADIEPGPVVDHFRRGIGRRLGVGTCRHVSRKCGSRKRDHSGCAKQKSFHECSPLLSRSTSIKQRGLILVASRQCRSSDRSLL